MIGTYWLAKEGFESSVEDQGSFKDVIIFPQGKITNSLKEIKDKYENIVFLGSKKTLIYLKKFMEMNRLTREQLN